MAGRGSRPGERRGGRKPGVPNKRTIAMKAKTEALIDAGISPLDYMLGVMRDPDADEKRRDAMASAAAPYCHHKLATIEHTGKDGGAIETTQVTDMDLAVAMARILTRGASSA